MPNSDGGTTTVAHVKVAKCSQERLGEPARVPGEYHDIGLSNPDHLSSRPSFLSFRRDEAAKVGLTLYVSSLPVGIECDADSKKSDPSQLGEGV